MAETNGVLYGGKLGQAKTRKTGDSKAKTDELIERFKAEYEAGWNKDRDNQDEAYRDLRLIGDDKTEHWDSAALRAYQRRAPGADRQSVPAVRAPSDRRYAADETRYQGGAGKRCSLQRSCRQSPARHDPLH